MAMRWLFPQPDLFETPPSWMILAPAERAKLVDQLRLLLMEAMAAPHVAAGVQDRWETGDDEDHA